ncbi:MAG: sugar phosphate isomerase/epimerase [Gemmataceae bacterium]|nr:sugar phosphate isomerase/epimerase [Gemmataceae bacterium]
MSRPILLFTNSFLDTPLEDLAAKAEEWGYVGFELCCAPDHFEVQQALSEKEYCPNRLELLARHDLQVPVLSNHRTSTAICDPIDFRHQALLPDYVWGDGQPERVRQRAIEEMIATFRAAEKLGVGVVSGFTGSALWSFVAGYPRASSETISAGLKHFAQLWNPILDVARDTGVKFAFEVHPGQMAFDIYSAEAVLDAIHGRPEFGFTFHPSHFHWQGIDPVEFLYRFPDRIFHVHLKDCMLTLNGRNGLLNGYLPVNDPRRGFQYRTLGRGGIAWEEIIRALNYIGYSGPMAVDWSDPIMDRETGCREACEFIKRLDFEPSSKQNSAFR